MASMIRKRDLLEKVTEHKLAIDEILLREDMSDILSDGHPMLMNLMYINFWLMVEKNKISEKDYPYVFRASKKMNEALTRMHNPFCDFYVFPKRKLTFLEKIGLFLSYNSYAKTYDFR